jgi:hypothetical protein
VSPLLWRAGTELAAQGNLLHEAHRLGVQAVVDQVLWAAQRLE